MPVDENPQLTIFAIPKPFIGRVDVVQRNAINSWRQLTPFVEVILAGDDQGVAEAARGFGVRHLSGIQTNRHGTPLLSSAFKLVHQHSATPLLAYCNSDVILLPDFVVAIRRLMFSSEISDFIAIGRRTNLQVDHLIDFGNQNEVQRLIADCNASGRRESIVCKEFFVFPRTRFRKIPDFAVGRGNWDNWMVHEAKRLEIPVVSVTDCVLTIHQNHDYAHVKSSRLNGYVSGEEARENQRLAGGRHLINGSTSDWRLRRAGLTPIRTNKLGLEFWSDFPRFVRLVADFTRRQ